MKNLLNKYETIKNGEKIKFIYLRTPNAINENVISFIDVIPKEFNLHNHIDFDKQFEKTYLDPIKIIFEAIGWKCEETSSLENFFF
jgi:DNA polymerase elongation subunit (family B)